MSAAVESAPEVIEIPRASHGYVGALIASLALFLLLQWVTIDLESLFIDEVDERFNSTRPIVEILYQPDSMPPLYNLMLKGWLSFWNSETSTRWMSVLFSVFTFVALWQVGWLFSEERVGSIALMLLALAPFFAFFAHLTRGYAFFCMVVSWEIVLTIRWIRNGSVRDLWLWGLVCALGSYTHYYNCFVVAVLFLAATIPFLRDRYRLQQIAMAALLFAVLSLPSGIFVPYDFVYQKNIREPRPISAATLAYAYESLIGGFSIGPSQRQLQVIDVGQAMLAILPMLPLFAASLLPLVFYGSRRLIRNGSWVLFLGLLCIPIGCIAGLSAATGLNFNVRFVAWMIVPMVWLLAAGIVEGWSAWIGKIATVGLLVILTIANVNRVLYEDYQHEDLRKVARTIDKMPWTRSETPVFVTSEYVLPCVRFYSAGPRRLIELPLPGQGSAVVETTEDASAAVDRVQRIVEAVPSEPGVSEQSMKKRFLWVYSRPFHGDPHGHLLREMVGTFQMTRVIRVAGAELFEGQVTPRQALQSE